MTQFSATRINLLKMNNKDSSNLLIERTHRKLIELTVLIENSSNLLKMNDKVKKMWYVNKIGNDSFLFKSVNNKPIKSKLTKNELGKIESCTMGPDSMSLLVSIIFNFNISLLLLSLFIDRASTLKSIILTF